MFLQVFQMLGNHHFSTRYLRQVRIMLFYVYTWLIRYSDLANAANFPYATINPEGLAALTI